MHSELDSGPISLAREILDSHAFCKNLVLKGPLSVFF